MDNFDIFKNMDKRTTLIVGIFIAVLLLVLILVMTLDSKNEEFKLPELLNSSTCPEDFIPYPVILISLDSFKPSYLDSGVTPTLNRMRRKGSSTPFMTTPFPSLTFPSHYSIVTGLYPESHGIIANTFYDEEFGKKFSYTKEVANEGRWWGGEPIWNTLEKHNLKSATYFWPGSEAPIQDHLPTYWFKYSKEPSIFERVRKVFYWLSLPQSQRPSLIVLYNNEPDSSGHKFGPDSEEVKAEVNKVDRVVDSVLKGLDERNLLSCVNVLVVSDHGMASGGPEKVIRLDQLIPANFTDKINFSSGAFGRITLKNGFKEIAKELEDSLSCKSKELKMFRREELPKRLHYSNNARIGDYVLLLEDGFAVNLNSNFSLNGLHGYDSHKPSMHSLFIAYGPAFREGFTIPPFQNTELYNLMCVLLGVEPAPNNGTYGLLHAILKQPPKEPSVEFSKIVATPPVTLKSNDELRRNFKASSCGKYDDEYENILQLLNQTQTEKNTLRNQINPWGTPESTNFINDIEILHHPDHITGYSKSMKLPLWTSFFAQTKSAPKYSAEWLPDGRLEPDATIPCEFYNNTDQESSFNLLPLFPPEFSKNIKFQVLTSLISNGVLFSKELELRWKQLMLFLIPKWTNESHSPISVIAGPIFDHRVDGLPDIYVPVENSPPVPSDYFAVVTKCSSNVQNFNECPENHLDSLAFIYPQNLTVHVCFNTSEDFALFFRARIKDVEGVTGLSFFPFLEKQQRTIFAAREKYRLW